jgi:biopolymer transport protein ExbD
MSHGPSSEGSSAEPNLTPLLDVVLQLLMFFMMCVNFVSEQVNEDIKLPDSEQAKPMDKGESDALFLNLRFFTRDKAVDKEFVKRFEKSMPQLEQAFNEGDACVLVPSRDPMNLKDLKVYLREEYDRAERNAKAKQKSDKGDGKVHTAVIIRAHRNTDYAYVYETFRICKDAKFENIKLRATTKNVRVK